MSSYNLYITSKDAKNKGEWEVRYNPPIEFPDRSKVALTQLAMYNSIYNISEHFPNNKFYLQAIGSANFLSPVQSGTGEYVIDSSNRLYTITIPNGQYSVEGFDEYIATQTGDYDFSTGSLLDYSNRKLVIDSNEATSKITFYYSSSKYDILFKVNDTTSKKLAYLLGLDMSLNGTSSDKKTINGVQYWSLNLYKSNRSITSTDALHIAEINNGITSVHLKILNNIIYGGRDAISDNSDTVFSFTFTTAPSFLEVFKPAVPTFLRIVSTGYAIDKLKFQLTDQDNNPLGNNIIENTSFVLTVEEEE